MVVREARETGKARGGAPAGPSEEDEGHDDEERHEDAH
jgi:hypothetical protein